jgi:hypothetical protein
MTAPAAPVSAATEQKYDDQDNQYQIHGISPLATAWFAARVSVQRHLEDIVPDKPAAGRLGGIASLSNLQLQAADFCECEQYWPARRQTCVWDWFAAVARLPATARSVTLSAYPAETWCENISRYLQPTLPTSGSAARSARNPGWF